MYCSMTGCKHVLYQGTRPDKHTMLKPIPLLGHFPHQKVVRSFLASTVALRYAVKLCPLRPPQNTTQDSKRIGACERLPAACDVLGLEAYLVMK